MLKKKTVFLMLILGASFCGICGCSRPGSAQADVPSKTPGISEAATPTPPVTEEKQTPVTPDTTLPPASDSTIASPTATTTPTATPTPTPTPIPTVPPAPVAVNTDTTTIDFIINRDYPLTENYKPDDLTVPDIPFAFSSKTADKRKLKKVAASALEELYNAALTEEGLSIYGVSGYRSYDRQYEIYGSKLAEYYMGLRSSIFYINLYSAAPGNSEHQTGLAIDVSCASVNYGLVERFADTAEGIWLKENSWRFGFILRYPKDKESITGYAYEPWHIRYVGVPLAYYLYTNNLTLEEYYGVPASQVLSELEDQPLISTTSERFYKLYASTAGSELLYKEDGSIWLSEVTGLPHLKEYIRDKEGNIIRLNGTPFYIEPIYNADGQYMLDAQGNLYYTRPYFDAEGNLWLDYNCSPVYLQPLWNADGTLATDTEGNLLYTEPLKDIFGIEVVSETGTLTLKVPVRDDAGELTYHADGTVVFYEPYVNPETGEFLTDDATGEFLYPYQYYEVPHNTLPLPKEETLPDDFWNMDDFTDSSFWNEDTVSEDTFQNTTDETESFLENTSDSTGGFLG